MKKCLGCTDLHYSLYLGPDVLRHCCRRFFVDGKMKGDVEIFNVSSNEDLSAKKILQHKKQLFDDINSGKETPCSGCPSLKRDDWEPMDTLKIKHLSIENHTFCNLKCSYCSDLYYGGKKTQYDIQSFFEEMLEQHVFEEDMSLVWGGGEPVLLKSFDETFETLIPNLSLSHNNVFTNAVVFNETIYKYLKQNKVKIVTSIDAGTPETYKKIKKFDKILDVFENLKKYYQAGKDNITIKYILLPENILEHELSEFTQHIKNYGLIDCAFQISANYKDGILEKDIINAAITLYNSLKEIGVDIIYFDDHLRERTAILLESQNSNNVHYDDIILWGTGEQASSVMANSVFFKNNTIIDVVDSIPEKIGKEFNGYTVKSPDIVLNSDNHIFIASVTYYRKIYNTLVAMGISKDRIIDSIYL